MQKMERRGREGSSTDENEKSNTWFLCDFSNLGF
jgi:hypothetical protein